MEQLNSRHTTVLKDVQERTTTLPQLIRQVATSEAVFSTTDGVSAGSVDVTEDALIVGENSIPMSEDVRLDLLSKAGAPRSYLAKRNIDIQILTLREHLRQGDLGDTLVPVLQRDQLFTLQGGGLVELSHSEMLSAAVDSLGPSADGLKLSRIDQIGGRLELELVTDAKTVEVRRGDVLKGGLHLTHSRFGGPATQIHSFVYRLVCTNGLIHRECDSSKGIVRTRKVPATHPRAKEIELDQIRRLTLRTWNKLEHQLRELRATSERRADVPQLLRQWLQRARLSTRTNDDRSTNSIPTTMDRLLRAWRAEGAEGTYYGAVNALTWVGSHDQDLSPRHRRVLSLLGGLLGFSGAHVCPRCFSVLSGPGLTRDAHSSEGELAIADGLPRTTESEPQ
jgi:hypothetical protein